MRGMQYINTQHKHAEEKEEYILRQKNKTKNTSQKIKAEPVNIHFH